MSEYYMNNQLQHHGIIGMKWGVRRYQNSDGTLTSAGKRRYRTDKAISVAESVAKTIGSGKRVETPSGARLPKSPIEGWTNKRVVGQPKYGVKTRNMAKDLESAYKKTKQEEKKAKEATAHEDYTKAHSKKSVKSMSNAELKARNNRLQMEKQYADLTMQTSTGKRVVQEFIKTAGMLSAVMGAYGTYKKVGNQILQSDVGKKMTDSVINTIGNIMLSDLFYKGH